MWSVTLIGHFGDLFRIIKNTDVAETMGVFDMLEIVRENTWKAGIEQKENRLEKVKKEIS